MARLAIDKDFLDDYSRLLKPIQSSVKTAIDKFAEHVHAGLHLEKITQCKNDRIRTIRIDQSWRSVVFRPRDRDTYCLLKVLPHDKAIARASSHRFTVNEAIGVDDRRAVLGVTDKLLFPRGDGVQWNPSDQLCLTGQVLVRPAPSTTWTLAGQIHAVEKAPKGRPKGARYRHWHAQNVSPGLSAEYSSKAAQGSALEQGRRLLP
jgi:hypothetical protein